MKQYKFDRNYLNLLIKNKDKLLDNNLVILVTYIEVLQDKLKAYENMRKELKNRIEYTNFQDVEDLEKFKNYLDELMNILNKSRCVYND